MMQVIIQTPEEEFEPLEALSIVLETTTGSAGILPRHTDMATSAPAGIAAVHLLMGRTIFVAYSDGLFVKADDEARLAVGAAVMSDRLRDLEPAIADISQQTDLDEHRAQVAATRLEASMIRRLIELERRHGPS